MAESQHESLIGFPAEIDTVEWTLKKTPLLVYPAVSESLVGFVIESLMSSVIESPVGSA